MKKPHSSVNGHGVFTWWAPFSFYNFWLDLQSPLFSLRCRNSLKWPFSDQKSQKRRLRTSRLHNSKGKDLQLKLEMSLRAPVPIMKLRIFNNYRASPNGLWVNSPWGRRPNKLLTQRPWGQEEKLSKIQLVGQKYRDKTAFASKTRFSRHCFCFQSRRFSPLVGFDI